jgi:hypothetical protein
MGFSHLLGWLDLAKMASVRTSLLELDLPELVRIFGKKRAVMPAVVGFWTMHRAIDEIKLICIDEIKLICIDEIKLICIDEIKLICICVFKCQTCRRGSSPTSVLGLQRRHPLLFW